MKEHFSAQIDCNPKSIFFMIYNSDQESTVHSVVSIEEFEEKFQDNLEFDHMIGKIPVFNEK